MRVSGKMGNNMVTASLQILKVIPELVYMLVERDLILEVCLEFISFLVNAVFVCKTELWR